VGDAHEVGHVRLNGERWLAISGAGGIPANTKVVVTAVQGTTLVVFPSTEIPEPPRGLGPERESL
jgi:membrane protein implicated in regulation of membrane protease activity